MIFDSFLKCLKTKFKDNEIISRELDTIDSDLVPIYNSVMTDFNRDLLYKSEMHGFNHNVRVSLFVLILSSSESITKEDLAILLEAAKYHDTGRNNDNDDIEHGHRSASIISFLSTKYSEEDMAYLKAIVEAHSIPDSDKDKMIPKYKLQDVNRYHRLLDVLKDSDALDRVRNDDLDPRFLRTGRAKELVSFAYELFNIYGNIFDSGKKRVYKRQKPKSNKE